MAANTKYQPAPQRDSFEEPGPQPQGYSQAPPAYQDSPSYQQEPAMGQPRTEDDNVAEDFKVSFGEPNAPKSTC